MKTLPQYLKAAIDAEVSNAYAEGYNKALGLTETLILKVKTYRVGGRQASKSQCIDLMESSLEYLKKTAVATKSKKTILLNAELE